MIKIPKLKKEHLKELHDMKETEGWRIIAQALDYSVQVANVQLANWKFVRGDDGEIKTKSIKEFEDIQREALMLKEFLCFLENCDKMISEGKKSLDPYE